MSNRSHRLVSLAALTGAATALVFVALTICLPPQTPSVEPPAPRALPGRDLDAIRRAGELRVALERDELDYEFRRGRAEGLAFDMARAFATRLGVELRVTVPPSPAAALARLARGEVDLVATSDSGPRPVLARVAWTTAFEIAQPVVIGRRAAGITRIEDLAGRRLTVRRHSALEGQAMAWRRSLDGEIEIQRAPPHIGTGELALGAATGRWALVVMDESRARLEQAVYKPLEISRPLPPSLPVRWAIHPDAQALGAELDGWLEDMRRSGFLARLRQRYLENPLRLRAWRRPVFRDGGPSLSPYDSLFRREADRIGFDWRLLAALSFAESGYDRWEISSQGAMGLLQIMPRVARTYGAEDPFDPAQNVAAGASLLSWLYGLFDNVPTPDRLAFTLAAYNMGYGHLQDARALAAMNGLNPDRWQGGVEEVLPLLEDPAVADRLPHGRARGRTTQRYVARVLAIFDRFTTAAESSTGLSASTH
ncbi:MAG: transglycosylase SLT domain-containing protein [Acidobacteriota bacterium]|nr:transglycosylase SLT domain-containing protein [Acidobacteriota bacterium]MDQ7087618.1 transglycosylase SLT domain-containing protein [Acidobacteriota bacterium]